MSSEDSIGPTRLFSCSKGGGENHPMSLIRERLCISALYLFLSLNCFLCKLKNVTRPYLVAMIYRLQSDKPNFYLCFCLPSFFSPKIVPNRRRGCPASVLACKTFCLLPYSRVVFGSPNIYIYITMVEKKGERVLIEIIANIIEPSSLAGRGEE